MRQLTFLVVGPGDSGKSAWIQHLRDNGLIYPTDVEEVHITIQGILYEDFLQDREAYAEIVDGYFYCHDLTKPFPLEVLSTFPDPYVVVGTHADAIKHHKVPGVVKISSQTKFQIHRPILEMCRKIIHPQLEFI